MAIFLIRHGETWGNAARVLQTPDTPLSSRGVVQARRLAQRLARAGVSRILSSDLTRALMTAEALRSATAASLDCDPLLQERNFGALRGTAYADLDVDVFAPDFAPPEGEDWETFHARVDRAWDRIRAAARVERGNLAVVTHGLVCLSLAKNHLARAASDPLPARFANASLSIIDAEPPWTLRLANCTAHLDGIADGDSENAPDV